MRQLTSLDHQFLAMETATTYGHVSGLAVYDPSTRPDGRLTRADICLLVGERIHLLPPFRWRLTEVPLGLDHPYWIQDPDFDLDFHIRETAVPPPGGPEQLATQVARIFSRPLDRAHPLWELYLIHGIDGDKVGLMTKIHHSAVDGVSGAEILSVLLDDSPEGRAVTPAKVGSEEGERRPGDLEMLARGLAGIPRQRVRALRGLPGTVANLDSATLRWAPGASTLARAAREIGRFVPGVDGGEGGVLDMPSVSAPRTRFNGPISPHRRFAMGQIPLGTVKGMKNAAGVSVNDVVVTICASAVREWLLERDELPAEPLVAMVPVSVRGPEERGTFGNRVSVMIAPVPTHLADPVERLRFAHETLSVAKERHRATPASLLQDATEFIPPTLMSRAARAIVRAATAGPLRPPLNLVISNLPGPREPLYLAGARLEAHYPVSVITDGVGLNITCMSYLDHIDFGVVCDRDQVDDAWPFIAAIERAHVELDDAVCGKRAEAKEPASA